jgi:site-specific recombinase XerD
MPNPLKVNTTADQNTEGSSSNLLFRTMKPASMAGFDINKYSGDTIGDTDMKLYRDVKIKYGTKWHVEFKHYVPVALRSRYQNRKWIRIKVYKDINVVKTVEYAERVKKAVELWLRDGYSPFDVDMDLLTVDEGPKIWTTQQAVLYFKQKWAARGISPKSIDKYNRTADSFVEWLTLNKMQHEPAMSITDQHIENYLEYFKEQGNANTTTNGERGFIGTIFTFLHKKKITQKVSLPNKLKASPQKHRYFDDRTYQKVSKLFAERDPYLDFAHKIVYYLCIRSEDELKYLQVGNIFPESKQVLLSKGKTGERMIPLVDEALELFRARKIFDYPPEYYVFSVPHRNKFVRDGEPGKEPFNTGFFSKRFARIRTAAKLSSNYTLMGLRHTRILHLKMDGVSDANIMSLSGHKTYEAYAKYLRDLGLTVDVKTLSEKTRKL